MPQSLMHTYEILVGNEKRCIVVTAKRIINDMDGNPRYKIQVWTDSVDGILWTPQIKGYRRCKDDTYILKCVYNLKADIRAFLTLFEEAINA